ncbi:MAG: helix-turn-helix transcriptional regulator [Eubacteriales bacterium]|nr:helix-turn-helix transcriptional regulator [Eubacteriales bacterium]
MQYKRLKDMREDADLTQAALASELKISQPQYHMYETGKRDVPTDILIALAKRYHTSVDYLLGLTDQK